MTTANLPPRTDLEGRDLSDHPGVARVLAVLERNHIRTTVRFLRDAVRTAKAGRRMPHKTGSCDVSVGL